VGEGSAWRWNHRVDEDYFSQAGDLFRLMTPAERQRLFENTARALAGATRQVQERHITNCTQADAEYGSGVAEALSDGGKGRQSPPFARLP